MDYNKLSLIGLSSALAISVVLNVVKLQPIKHVDEEQIVQIDYPDEIKKELTSRVRTFLGEDGFKKLEGSFVVVVGLGGVGSHCANMLVRSGVGKIRLIDFDQVTLSSLNRHAVANMNDVGTSKAEAMRKQLLQIVPWCNIEAITQMFRGEVASHLLLGEPDFVLDCIDDVSTKAELIAHCVKNNIPVLTSMGAGGKADPTRLRVAPLSDCINDPLASKIKWKLKKHNIQADNVMCVFSAEKPRCDLLPLDEEQRLSPQDYGSVDYVRLRVMPVLGTSPSMFGQAMASYILCSMAGKMYEPEVCERMSKNLKHKVMQALKKNEVERFLTDREVDLDEDDMEFVVQQIWRSRCAVTGRRFGGHVILTLTRWDASRPPASDNLVLLMQTQARLLVERGQDAFSPDIVRRISERLAWASRVSNDDDDFVRRDSEVLLRTLGAPLSSDLFAYAFPRSVAAALFIGTFLAGFGVARWKLK